MSVNRDNQIKLEEDLIWITSKWLWGEFDYSVWIILYILISVCNFYLWIFTSPQ